MTQTKSTLDYLIGQRLREVRVERGLSQEAIGRALDVSFQQVQKYERGINRLSAHSLLKIEHELGIPASYLLDAAREQPEPTYKPDDSASQAFTALFRKLLTHERQAIVTCARILARGRRHAAEEHS